MGNRSLGTPQNSSGQGLDPQSHRQILRALYPTPGIVDGLTVSGTSGLTYHVDSGVGIVEYPKYESRIMHFDGGNTGAVSAADPSNPRIDAIWIKPNDPTTDSDKVDVVCGVTQGQPSGNPVEPQVPAGALRLMGMRVPAGAESTQNASPTTDYSFAIPYGGNLGRLGENWNRSDQNGAGDVGKQYFEQPISFYVQTDRLIELIIQVNYSSVKSDSEASEWSVQFQMDGQDIPHAATNFRSGQSWETHEFHFITTVTRGPHTARLRTWLQWGAAPHFHYSSGTSGYSSSQYIGRRFQIFDRGVAN